MLATHHERIFLHKNTTHLPPFPSPILPLPSPSTSCLRKHKVLQLSLTCTTVIWVSVVTPPTPLSSFEQLTLCICCVIADHLVVFLCKCCCHLQKLRRVCWRWTADPDGCMHIRWCAKVSLQTRVSLPDAPDYRHHTQTSGRHLTGD